MSLIKTIIEGTQIIDLMVSIVNITIGKTLCRQSLYTLGDIHHQNHQVDDLSTPNDHLDKRRMPGTVD